MMLVKIPGTECWVNPEYVTSIRPWKMTYNEAMTHYQSEVEFEGNAGYRTRTATSTCTPDELAQLLMGQPTPPPEGTP